MSGSTSAPRAGDVPSGQAPGPRRGGRAAGWLPWGGLAVVVALAVLAVVKLDLRALARALAAASPALLAAATAGALGALLLQAVRWLALVRPVVGHARKRDAFGALLAAYAIGLVLPARTADLARAHLLAQRTGASTAALTATSFLDRLVAAAGLFLALALLAGTGALPPWLARAGVVSAGLAAAALAALWLLRPRHGPPGQAGARGGPAGVLARLRGGLVAVGRPRALGASALLAVAAWAAEVGVTMLCLRAFGLPWGPGPAALLAVATALSATVAVSPGNAGAFEVACVLALAGLDVPGEPALAFALGYHAVHLVPVALVGGAWLALHGVRPRRAT